MKFTDKAAAALAVADRIAEAVTDDLIVSPSAVRVSFFADEDIQDLRHWLARVAGADIVPGNVWHNTSRRDFHAIVDGVRVMWSQPVRVTVVDED